VVPLRALPRRLLDGVRRLGERVGIHQVGEALLQDLERLAQEDHGQDDAHDRIDVGAVVSLRAFREDHGQEEGDGSRISAARA